MQRSCWRGSHWTALQERINEVYAIHYDFDESIILGCTLILSVARPGGVCSEGVVAGVWGGAPSGVQGQISWSGGPAAKPPEAEVLSPHKREEVGKFATLFSILLTAQTSFWKRCLCRHCSN